MKAKLAIEVADNGYVICDEDNAVFIALDGEFATLIGTTIQMNLNRVSKENPTNTRIEMTIEFKPTKSKIEL